MPFFRQHTDMEIWGKGGGFIVPIPRFLMTPKEKSGNPLFKVALLTDYIDLNLSLYRG